MHLRGRICRSVEGIWHLIFWRSKLNIFHIIASGRVETISTWRRIQLQTRGMGPLWRTLIDSLFFFIVTFWPHYWTSTTSALAPKEVTPLALLLKRAVQHNGDRQTDPPTHRPRETTSALLRLLSEPKIISQNYQPQACHRLRYLLRKVVSLWKLIKIFCLVI